MKFLLLVIAVYAIALSSLAAQTASPPLTLDAALTRVLADNPSLRANAMQSAAANARIRQQQQQSPWEVGIELDNFGGSGALRGVDAMETTLSLGRLWELDRKVQLRGQVARDEAMLLGNEHDVQRLDLLAGAAQHFVDILYAQERRLLARERVEQTQRTRESVRRRVQLGADAQTELSKTEIDVARAELALEETDHLLAVARHELAVLWGELTPDFGDAKGDLYHLEPIPDFIRLEQGLDAAPELHQYANRQRIAQARLRLAEAQTRPDLEIRGGLRHLNEADDVGLMLSLRIPLGSQSRAIPDIQAQRALRDREPMLAQERQLALRATIFALVQELAHDEDVIRTLEEKIIPAAEVALALYRKGYSAGRYSLNDLTQAQNTLLEARMEKLQAAFDYQSNRNEIDRLTGGLSDRVSTSGDSQ